MAVAIIETWYNHGAIEVDYLSMLILVQHHLFLLANIDDVAICHGDGIERRVIVASVLSDKLGIDENQVSTLGILCRLAANDK